MGLYGVMLPWIIDGDHVLGILTTVPGGHASVHQHHASCSFLCRDHQSTVLGRSLHVPPCNIMESYVRINGTGMDGAGVACAPKNLVSLVHLKSAMF